MGSLHIYFEVQSLDYVLEVPQFYLRATFLGKGDSFHGVFLLQGSWEKGFLVVLECFFFHSMDQSSVLLFESFGHLFVPLGLCDYSRVLLECL